LAASKTCCSDLQAELEQLKASSMQNSQGTMLQDLTNAKAENDRLQPVLVQVEHAAPCHQLELERLSREASLLQAELWECKNRMTEVAAELALERANVVQLRCDLVVARGLNANALDAQHEKCDDKKTERDLFADNSSSHEPQKFLGKAERCDLCGKRKGFIMATKGFGWRERTHRHRCERRTADRI